MLLMQLRLAMERCIRDYICAWRAKQEVVKITTLRQSPEDTKWLTKLRCYTAVSATCSYPRGPNFYPMGLSKVRLQPSLAPPPYTLL
jgi:hypothetical protein